MNHYALRLFAIVLSTSSFADDPIEPYTSAQSGFRMNAIEYWGNCGYSGGNGVSFGYETNTNAANQACAVASYEELKAAMDGSPPEMAELAELDGPTTIYLIMSDCAARGSTRPSGAGRMWHYSADDNGTGGLIKFHAYTTTNAQGQVVCVHPTREDFYTFIRTARDRILNSTSSGE